ncbi:MAG: hypothetical protein Q9178_002434 [Gyalolechia marmorata]
MGIDQTPAHEAPTKTLDAEASPYTRTRSRTATTPTNTNHSKVWKPLDDELSVLPSPAFDSLKAASRKRKQPSSYTSGEMKTEDGTPPATPKKRKTTSPKKKDEEKRLRHFRNHAPGTYLQRLERAQSQRMFVIDRTRSSTADEPPSETISMAGTTGNIYDITISHIPRCTCPDNLKGNQCKHIIYVLHNVLKAPEHLQYQLAFLTSELHLIFAQAPLPPSSSSTSATDPNPSTSGTPTSNRKPITGDCPICFMEFHPPTEQITYCKAACGNNIHTHCFEQWARVQSKQDVVRCVYCRTPWQQQQRDVSEFKDVVEKGKRGEEGYVNVGKELGLSARRDMSSYHRFWVRRQGGRGNGEENDDDGGD